MCFTSTNNCGYTIHKVTVIPVNCTISEQYFPLKSTLAKWLLEFLGIPRNLFLGIPRNS